MVDSLAVAACNVSYLDIDGIRHTVEVQAETLFEAAALAMSTFRRHGCAPGEIMDLEVEIRSSVTHTVKPQRVRQWLEGGAKSPKEAILKERLRSLL